MLSLEKLGFRQKELVDFFDFDWRLERCFGFWYEILWGILCCGKLSGEKC